MRKKTLFKASVGVVAAAKHWADEDDVGGE